LRRLRKWVGKRNRPKISNVAAKGSRETDISNAAAFNGSFLRPSSLG
jgi:hypothetical protein